MFQVVFSRHLSLYRLDSHSPLCSALLGPLITAVTVASILVRSIPWLVSNGAGVFLDAVVELIQDSC